MHRITGQDDRHWGTSGGQVALGFPDILGHDAQMMPVRCQLKEGDTFKTYAQRMKQQFLASYENRRVSLPQLLGDLKFPLDPSRVPLVSVMFNFDPGMKTSEFKFNGLDSSFFFNHRNFETFEISINAAVEGADIVLETACNAALFSREGISERLSQFDCLIASLSRGPDTPVFSAQLVPDFHRAKYSAALTGPEQHEKLETVDTLVVPRRRYLAPSPCNVVVSLTYLKSGKFALRRGTCWIRPGARPLMV